MSDSRDIPQTQAFNSAKIGSPSAHGHFLVPSPLPTRRTRTKSMSELAAEGPSFKGVVRDFCRQRGHGFIIPNEGESSTPLFVHISDIDGEWVPQAGDTVAYKTIPVPPKMEKMQAVHVQIIHLKPGEHHERWDSSS